MTNLNVFKNLKTSTSFVSVDISLILEAIETGKFINDNKVIHTGAKLASAEDKYSDKLFIDGVNKYNYMKLNKVMSWTPNASFNDSHRRTDKLKELSGFIYCDIDGVEPNEAKAIVSQLSFVYAAWKSLSGTGIGFLIKAGHLTADNFKTQYQALSSYFEASYEIKLDKTSDFTRTNVFSYDPDIYINAEATNIDSTLLYYYTTLPKVYVERTNTFDFYSNGYSDSKVNIAINKALKSKGRFILGNRHHFLTSLIGTAMVIGIPYETLVEEFENYLIEEGDFDLFDIMYFDNMWDYFVDNYGYQK